MSSGDLSADELSDWIKERDNGSFDKVKKQGGPEGVAKKLKMDLKKGLTDQEAKSDSRKQQYGENKLPKPKPKSFFSFLFTVLQDKTLIMLMVLAVLSIILREIFPPLEEGRSKAWIDGAAILIAVAVVSLVTSANDFSKDRKFAALSAEAENRKIKVIRDGKQQEISVYDLVVGDLVSLETGDYIAADCLLYKAQGLQSDESPMTGEPESVNKTPEEDPFLLGGCTITGGSGKAVCVAVGKKSQWGVIKGSLEKPETKTPLQVKLEVLAERIGKFGLVFGIVTLIVLLLRWSIKTYGIDKKAWEWGDLNQPVDFIITAITIIVVAVPEGLPLAVTLSLAYSMVQMMKENNLVRHLSACETMGGATNICSDKTGTLTQNKMTVIKYWLAGKLVDKVEETQGKSEVNEKVLDIFTESICTNSTAYITEEDGKPRVVGTKTEGALLVLAKKLGYSYDDIRRDREVKMVYPFSSKKKRMSSLVQGKDSVNLHVKGASETVLDLCDSVLDQQGNEKKFEENTKQDLLKQIDDWASKGYRTLTIAYTHNNDASPVKETEDNLGPLDKNLILIGIVAIEDPIRDEIADSVKKCQQAGITVRMVTGDNLLTAKNIAEQCGIYHEGGVAIEGPKFRQLSDQELDEIIPKLQVVARCSPEDKLILVKRLRHHGEVVACTGDGSNDAPILREADVGFAMGISGTEVAKDACDIVLMDDNFASIVNAVLWGRNVFDSIRKFLQFQLTVNCVAVIVAFVGACTTGESPLKAIQMLWVNLIMDTLAALALATQPPTPDLLDRKPYGRNGGLITPRMWRQIIGQAIYQLFILFFILYAGQLIGFLDIPSGDSDLRGTIIFNAFVFCQIFNEFNCRKLNNEINIFSGILKNYIFLGVFLVTVIVQALMVQFGSEFAHTTPLNWKQWMFCIVIGAISIPLGLALKLIPVPEEKYVKPEPMDEEDEDEDGDHETVKGHTNFELRKSKSKDEVTPLISRKNSGTPLLDEQPITPRSLTGSRSGSRGHSRNNSSEEIRIDVNAPVDTTDRALKNWRKAQAIYTQQQVVSAFRKSRPGTRF